MNDVDTNLCTHFVYSFLPLDIETNNNLTTEWENLEEGETANFMTLKGRNPNLKLIVELSLEQERWNETHVKLMGNIRHINTIAKNAVDFVRKNKLDGLFFHFFPTENEETGFMNLLRALRKAFEPHSYVIAVTGNLYES